MKQTADCVPYEAGAVDLVVIGAGHAGCEAGLAAARLGLQVLVLAMNLDSIGNLPCNPSIGGTAKGQLVREIDALGGEMGRAADGAMIQYRMLNSSRGPAVMSPRAQIDRRRYQEIMRQALERQDRLRIRQGEAVDLLTRPEASGLPRICGVRLATGAIWRCRAAVLATGTFLGGRIIIGEHRYQGGPDNQFAAVGLTESLRRLGLPLRRFKTGTPPRVDRRSLDFARLERQDGDQTFEPFSFAATAAPDWLEARQEPCWLSWTTEKTEQIIRDNLDRSPLYSGVIEGVGVRYCPSIEDKIVRFPDKPRHQIFLEPMGRESGEMYVQGLSSSMPEDVQRELVRSVPGMEQAHLTRSAYAIEYDCLDPTCLRLSLETRAVAGLFSAGQINGSSGYEEAAAQGLVAGVNVVRMLKGQEPLVIGRDQGYIGVLIDDLVTKGTPEPYRMMTARAEYRLVLRQDNADLRLTPTGRQIGLIDDAAWARFTARRERIAAEIARLEATRVTPAAAADLLQAAGTTPLSQSASLADLLRRPELTYAGLAPLDPQRPELAVGERQSVEIELKYAGYVRLEEARLSRFRKLEETALPEDFPYQSLNGLRLEARQKLARQKPASIGQASRISGVSPADIQVLLVALKAWARGGAEHGEDA